jgi:hypothetical protein
MQTSPSLRQPAQADRRHCRLRVERCRGRETQGRPIGTVTPNLYVAGDATYGVSKASAPGYLLDSGLWAAIPPGRAAGRAAVS